MLKALTRFFEQSSERGDESSDSERDLELATAVLLVEVARADFSEDDIETDTVSRLLTDHLDMTPEETGRLIDEARQKADHSASLQSFTRQLHEELSLNQKLRIIEMLWEVALADAKLDKHEDHLIRRVAGLLYISHGDLIRIRNLVREKS